GQGVGGVRAGAGDRAGGGRRDRGGGGGGAPHREGAGAAGGDAEGDGGGVGAGGGDRVDPGGGVRADGVRAGDHGADVPAVCGDDRGLGGDLGVQRADAVAGAGGDAAAAAEAGAGTGGGVLSRVQPVVRPRDRRLRVHGGAPHPQGGYHAGPAAGDHRRGRAPRPTAALRVRPRGRPGLHVDQRPASGGGVGAAHRHRVRSDR